ncbi:regulatory protein SWI5 [Cladophialophora psammophila CBS 110553]|uniref:Regulatory protein SWI5 n=1 Tax=Cladophialophora psammophila CBS 110553 TaxID=1182543 RepID=W9WZM9_9EURO|nr:regulatory protein SWI5 [Cladophialophora psammophila CBS 110553]EXJ73677.1 regulatory protein SWI5 [Cladophialophora psammophila CBS 110553]
MPQQPRHNLHRRGQSFDLQRSPIRKHQQGSTVSMTNLGSIHGQQILREAQQQRIARPGQQQPNMHMDIPISPGCGMFPATTSMPASPYNNMRMNAIMQQSSPGMTFAHSQQYFTDMNMSMQNGVPAGLMDENSLQYFHEAQALQFPPSVGISFDNRRMSQPDLRIQTQLRPHTPSHQIQSGEFCLDLEDFGNVSNGPSAQFPLTPPFSQHNTAIQYSRSLQASPALQSPYPVPMTRGKSLQGIIEHEELRTEFGATPTRPSFEMAEMPVPEPQRRAQTPPAVQQAESTEVKVESATGEMDRVETQVSKLEDTSVPVLSTKKAPAGSASPGRPALSQRRMSISNLNLEPGIEASIEETNITLDDIAQFIEGPDPADNKWVCKYEDCNKKFGRKENIKSHIQTHLGDRQFRCDHCKKCFVRGHDLKRHAKIHTGTKPYPCPCGNSFARHDALTRHRQRGMCAGAFAGVVRKVMKRGRPRKPRPELDERVEKANRTRQGTTEQPHDPYTSSASSCSMSSWGSPPTETMDNLSIRGSSPFESMAQFGMPQHNLLSMDQMTSFPPDTFSFTPPHSPGYSTGNKPSPVYRELTPAELAEISELQHSDGSQMLPALPSMDDGLPILGTTVNVSSGHSLPSLSHSCSSPAADIVAFDFSDLSTDPSPVTHSPQLPIKMEQHEMIEFDNFLDYGRMDMGLDPSAQDFFTI